MVRQIKCYDFQEKLFQQQLTDNSIMFAQADKNLGPVSVSIIYYIQDGLIHLKDKTTYQIISEEQALAKIK